MFKKIILPFVAVLYILLISSQCKGGEIISLKFKIYNNTKEQVSIIQAYQLECLDKDCKEFDTIQNIFPSRFYIEGDTLVSTDLFYEDYHRIVLVCSDTTRVSNTFRFRGKSVVYKLIINESNLRVIEKITFLQKNAPIFYFIISLILVLFIEAVVTILMLSVYKKPWKTLVLVLGSNLISFPVVWIFFPMVFTLTDLFVFALLFSIIFEFSGIYFLMKKHLSLRYSFILSSVLNLCSFIIGATVFAWIIIKWF